MTKLTHILSCALLVNASIGFAAKPLLEKNNAQLNVSLNNFLALSCDTSGNICTAVGQDNNPGDPGLLVYQSQDAGLSWSIPSPLPKLSDAKGSDQMALATDIHCDSSGQRCFIISSAKINSSLVLLAYNNVNNQQSWNQPTVLSLPKSKLQKDGQYIYAKLSCSYSGFSCIIAGTMRVGIQSVPFIYTTRDAGNQWTTGKSLKEPSSTYSNGISLYNAHCDNSGFLCKAVGYALTRNSFWSNYYTSKPVVYTTEDGGSHWSAPVVLPCDVDQIKKVSTLTDVECDGTGMHCMTVGFTEDLVAERQRFFSFTTLNGGKDWEKSEWINPDYSNEFFAALNCDDSMLNCTLVGSEGKMLQPRRFYLKGLIYSIANGQSWEKNISQQFSAFSYFTDVFCGKYTNQCLAVGVHESSSTIQTQQLKHNSYELYRKLPAVTERQ